MMVPSYNTCPSLVSALVSTMSDILVLYYSRNGSVKALAECIAQGIESVPGAQARMRTVPPVAPLTQTAAPPGA